MTTLNTETLNTETLNTENNLSYVYIPIAGASNRYAILKVGMHFYDDDYQFLISNIRLDQKYQFICMDAVVLPNSLTGIEESYTCTFVSGSLVFDGFYVNPADSAVGSCERHMIPSISTVSISDTKKGRDESTELFSQGDVVRAKGGFSDEVLLLTHPIYMGDNFAQVITKQVLASRHCIKGKALTKIGSFTVPEGVR